MRGLSLVGPTGIDMVIGPNRDVERLFCISVEVADENTKGAVGILVPSFKGAGNASAGIANGFERQLIGYLPTQDKYPTHGSNEKTKTQDCRPVRLHSLTYCWPVFAASLA